MAKDSVGVKQSIISRVLATLIFCIFLVSVGTTFLFGRQRYQNVRTAALADVKLDLFHSQRMIAENLNLARQSAQRLLEHWPRLAPQSDAHSAANNQTIFMADPGVRADGSLAAKARWAVQILNTTQASAEDTFFDLPGVGTALQHPASVPPEYLSNARARFAHCARMPATAVGIYYGDRFISIRCAAGGGCLLLRCNAIPQALPPCWLGMMLPRNG